MSSSTYHCADFLCNDFDRRWPQKQCLWQKLNSLLCNKKAGSFTARPRLVRLLNLSPGSSTLSYSQFTLEDSRNNLILTLWQIDFPAEVCPQRQIPSFYARTQCPVGLVQYWCIPSGKCLLLAGPNEVRGGLSKLFKSVPPFHHCPPRLKGIIWLYNLHMCMHWYKSAVPRGIPHVQHF